VHVFVCGRSHFAVVLSHSLQPQRCCMYHTSLCSLAQSVRICQQVPKSCTNQLFRFVFCFGYLDLRVDACLGGFGASASAD
jgi:hypothetical protein